ncbi:MAG TPA: metallopeptidase family protein [Caulobacteraceae bacterium]|jgi:predicted Zn-dependent protease with MMP-like domain|nr:metallopeptidase family protein [Caulobacteraceae bacterium]
MNRSDLDARHWGRHPAPDIDAFTAMAEAAWERLPQDFRRAAGNVEFRVQDFADDATLDALGIEDPFELSGLYHGVDLTHQSVFNPSPNSSQIFLFRRPILDEWSERGNVTLDELVTHVLIHEIGHHFGLSDDAMHAIEDEA